MSRNKVTFILGTGGLGIWRSSGDYPNYSIIENGQNIEKSPGDLRSLAITQSPVKNHQLTLMSKTLMSRNKVTFIPIGTGGLGIWRSSGDYPNYSIIENGQNIEKSPGDLRRLAITQSPVKNHQLTLMSKTLMSRNKVTFIPIGTGGLGIWRSSGDYPNYSIIENGQNIEKSPGDLRSLAITQSPVKNHQLTLMSKTLMSRNKVTFIPIGTGGLGIWRSSGDYPNYSIIENGQNIEKSPGDLRRLAITQSPVKNHQLPLISKTVMSRNKVTFIPIGTGGLGIWRSRVDYPNYSIIENGQNIEKSPGDLRRLAITQSPVKNHQLTLMSKTVMSRNNKVTFIPIGTGGLGIWRSSGDFPNYSIIENGQNIEKSPGDLTSLPITQSPVKSHQLTLMSKTVMSRN